MFLSFVVHFADWCTNATLIASSKIRLCGRDNLEIEPKFINGRRCEKKFIVALTVENGQVS